MTIRTNLMFSSQTEKETLFLPRLAYRFKINGTRTLLPMINQADICGNFYLINCKALGFIIDDRYTSSGL